MVAQPNRQQAINRALDRAHDQARAGNVPTLVATIFDGAAIRETWQVSSRTSKAVYEVKLSRTASAITTECTCKAAENGLICHHRAAARLATSGAIKFRNRAGLHIRPRQ